MTARAASLRGHTRGAASPERFSEWYSRNRARSRALFDLITDEAYYSRPIDLRHPIVFYEGHLPAFSFNTLVKRGLGGPGIDERLEQLFARGIDPHEQSVSGETARQPVNGVEAVSREGWPSRELVQQFAAEADRRVLHAIEHESIE